MSRYQSYLNSAKNIISSYHGEEPFASFLKKYFSGHKKMGSTDRKKIAQLCYCYFRTGKALLQLPIEEKIIASLFLCSSASNDLLAALQPEWNERVDLSIPEKIILLQSSFSYEEVFPAINALSEGIRKEEFVLSHFQQPDLFLRLRPGKESKVIEKIEKAGIAYKKVSTDCLALPNTSKIDEVIKLDEEAVVQDYSSQRVGEFADLVRRGPSDQVWDCCAGSGGKSIMLYDLYPGINLTVSDVRESILVNLRKRFAAAGIKKYKVLRMDHTQTSDLQPPTSNLEHSTFHLVLADVPCTGSGTWGRNPEQLVYFDKGEIDAYSALQRKIVSAIIPHLNAGSYLLYSTCSVFAQENEEMISFIKQNFHLSLIKMEMLEGYNLKADTMFAALLQKSL